MKKSKFHYAWIVVGAGTIGVMGALGLVYFAFGFSYIAYATFFSAHVIKAANLTQAEAGRIWSLAGFVSLASGLIWGGVSDWIVRRAGLLSFFAFTPSLSPFSPFPRRLSVFMFRHWPSASPPGAFPPSWPRFPVTLQGLAWRRQPWEWSPSSSAPARPWRLMWPGNWPMRRALFHTRLCLRHWSLWREPSAPCS